MIVVWTVIGAITGMTGLVVSLLILWRRSRQPTWKDALNAARKVLQSIQQSKWKPTVVVGIGRSGGI